MHLAIIAAVLHGTAYSVYIYQIYGGGSAPNPSSWTVWVVLSALASVTFWKGTKSALATAQFFTGAAASIAVWTYAFFTGNFSPLATMDWMILLSCLFAIGVWRKTGKATYANIVIGVILIVSFIPTVAGVLLDPSREQPLAWMLWAAAFCFTSLNGYRRRHKEHEVDWRPMLFIPVTMVLAHGMVGVLVL